MTQSKASPPGFEVQRVGSPELPEASYFVLDAAHDPLARECLAMLGAKYYRRGQTQLADEVRTVLRDSNETFLRFVEAQQPKKKKATKSSMKGVTP